MCVIIPLLDTSREYINVSASLWDEASIEEGYSTVSSTAKNLIGGGAEINYGPKYHINSISLIAFL